MPAKTLRRTLIYKRAHWVGVDEPPDQLSQLLSDAYRRLRCATQRRQPIGEEGNHRVANDIEQYGQLTAGNLVEFTIGQHQLVLRLDDGAEAYEINELAPADDRSQFLEGQLFFGVWGNNVVLIQSKSLRVGHLEIYLSWLLTEAVGIVQRGARLVLQDQPNDRARQAARLDDVTLVSVRSRISSADILHPDEQAPEGQKAMSSVVRSFLGDRRQALSAAQALAVEEYNVQLVIKRGRKKSNPRSVIDELAEVVRDTDLEFELQSKSIGRLRRDDLQLTKTENIRINGKALRLTDVRDPMYQWLVHLIDKRRVSP